MSFGIPIRNGLGVGLLSSTFLTSKRAGGTTQTMGYDFTSLTAATFPSAITFTRASRATLIDSTGALTWAPNNALLNTATLSTQNVTTVASSYILSFTGTGTVTLTGTATGSLVGTGAGNRVYLKFTATAGTLTCTVSGSVTLAQLEPVTYQTTPSQYAASGASQYNGPRFDYDPNTLASKGFLIEAARTNSLTQSLISGTNLLTQNVTVTAVAWTLSFYGTGTVVLTGAATGTVVGVGAYPNRTTFTFTPTAGTLTLTIAGTVQFAQLEAGAFATSFIPTGAAGVARSVDMPKMTGTNFSSWFNPVKGTFTATFDSYNFTTATPTIFSADAGTTRLIVESIFSTGRCNLSNGTANVSPANTYTANSVAKVAASYSAGLYQNVMNGGTVATATTATVNTVDTLEIGMFNTSSQLNGHMRKIGYYPTIFSNAEIQALTV